MPAIFSGITSLKPTAGRLPLTGQGSDGGLTGVVGIHNTVGIMGRSASDIELCFKELVNLTNLAGVTACPRLVHIQWRDQVAKIQQNKLRIGW
jgi:Asp-tRNA(Asn)/Glu-tRNA(Gln) amidotransferase A subunit family amidase